MNLWSSGGHLLERSVITTSRSDHLVPTVGDDVLPFSDEFYWEKQCDRALSAASDESLSRCEDFDDDVAAAAAAVVTDYESGRSADGGPSTKTALGDELLPDSGSRGQYRPISSYALFVDSNNGASDPEVLTSAEAAAANGIPPFGVVSVYTNADEESLRVDASWHQKSGHRCKKPEVGLHNINKQYLNRLNVVLSLMLVVCSIIGIGLFLFYMLSCNG